MPCRVCLRACAGEVGSLYSASLLATVQEEISIQLGVIIAIRMNYRSVIEVLQWSDVRTILGLAETSQVWRQVCASEELWDSLLASSSLTPDPSQSNLPPKSAYKLLSQQQRCLLVERFVYLCMTAMKTAGCKPGIPQMLWLQLDTAASMMYARSYHSAVCVNKVVYVFGNDAATNHTGERFDRVQWKPKWESSLQCLCTDN